jgi:hypothetical protein
MVDNSAIYGFVNPIPGLPAAEQRKRISAKFNVKEWFTVGVDGDFDSVYKLLRPGRLWAVAHIGVLADHRGSKDARFDSMLELKAAIHRKEGAFIVEASGRRSDKDWRKMRPDGEDVCRRLGQGRKSALNALKGQPPYEFTDDQLVRIDRIMKRKYPRDEKLTPDDRRLAAVAALCKKWNKPTPKRTWLKTKLPLLLVQRGLLD